MQQPKLEATTAAAAAAAVTAAAKPTVSKGGAKDKNIHEPKRLFITHVNAFGPYLQVSGQLNPDAMAVVRNKMQQVLATSFAIDPTWEAARQQTILRAGVMCIYKSVKGAAPADYDLLRARIVHVNVRGGGTSIQVEVEMVDYGYTKVVSSYELLFPQHYDVLQHIPVLGSQYIMLGICKDWKQTELDEILGMISKKMLDICIEMEFNQFKFITMKWKDFNFSEYLIHQKKIGAPIANNLLRENFLKFLKQQQKPQKQQEQHSDAGSVKPASNENNNTSGSSSSNSNSNSNASTNYSSNNNNNTNNNNIYSMKNKNNNNFAGSLGDGSYASGAHQMREQMAAKRSLQARLQRNQYPQMEKQHPMMHLVKPCMPHTIGNLRSMMQGIHLQNNRIPYTGPNFQQFPIGPYGGAVRAVPLTDPLYASSINTFQARHQRPQMLPQPYNGGGHMYLEAPSVPPSEPPRRTNAAVFKSSTLTVGKTYDVCVSFVENGPCLFSVQLGTAQEELTQMMNQIERVQFKPLAERPAIGTACIARYSEDGQLYRALITNVQGIACKVAYIDYGNAEVVELCDLYEITDEFLQPKVFAIRFTLSGHKELEPIDDSLKKTFKDLIMYQNCKLKVMPLEGPPLVQYCELYMQNQNILEVLKEVQKCRLVYPKAECLQSGDIVEVRYTDSPKCFYVQKMANNAKFQTLMDEMFLYYNKNQVVPNNLNLGAPCMVKSNNEWYRAEIMRADAITITVRYVDYGNEKNVTKNLIGNIAEEHLKMPRQAVQCCLKGFENNEQNMDLVTAQMEMLAEDSIDKRRRFSVKVFRIQPDGVHLVNLCAKDLDLMKKLYKLSMPFDRYLSFEKDELNMRYGNHNQKRVGENGHKSPSLASSNELSSLHSSKKGLLNSPQQKHQPVARAQQHQQQQQQQHLEQRQLKSYNNQSNSEWEKNSSVSSADKRDTRSSSSDYKQGKRGEPHHQQQQLQQQHYKQGRGYDQQYQQQKENIHNVSAVSGGSEIRSTGSGASSSSYNRNRGVGNNNNAQTRYQNTKQDRRQQNKQAQQQTQRPQNAPQGYSQTRQSKPAATNRSSDLNSTNNSITTTTTTSEEQSALEEYMALDHAFPTQRIETPRREEVIISWWVSPHQFYTHLKTRVPEFERLMHDMQKFYKKKTWQHLQLKVGSHIIARYRKDNVLYRARVLGCNQMLRKYKVHFVDFGNQYMVTADDIWPVEKRFAQIPCMAYLCSFKGIVSNYDHLYIIDRMEKYLPVGAALVCEYQERDQDMYYVNVNVNKASLKEALKADSIISEVCPELRLDLLAEQQIRAKICSVKDMLNFKIHIEGCDEKVQLLCSYDDVRFVKSNADIAHKFKQFYEGKSCVVNVRTVNENKVILLRPLLPLLKEETAKYICTYPIILDSFEVRVVYIKSATRFFGQLRSKESEMAQLLDDMHAHYEHQGNAPMVSLENEQICAAKSKDGNWYRARVTGTLPRDAGSDSVEVFYIDYGSTERVQRMKLKHLNEKFYANRSACAVEVNLPVRLLMAEQPQKGKGKKSTVTDTDAAAAAAALEKLISEQVVTVKATEVRHNHLIADVNMQDGRSVVDVLKEQKLIKGRDIDYMRKLLDKEKPNMYEYIETVDLTLEDEEEAEKKQVHKAKTSSPKKKKVPKVEEKAEKPIEKPKDPIKPAVAKNTETVPTKGNVGVTSAPAAAVDVKPESAAKIPEPQVIPAAIIQSKPEPPAVPVPVPVPEPAPAPELEPEPEPIVDPYADMEHAVLSHCDNPAHFFVHPQQKLDELCKLQENLQIVASLLPPLMRVINGAHCISLYSVDKQWYRAKILDAELMVLQFIDYGNTDCVSDTTDVKEMNVFPNIEPLCMPCALPIKPNGTADWVDAANAIFNDSYTKVLHFEYIVRGDNQKRSYINLFIEGVNIAEKLIADGFAKPLEVVESGQNCYISHVNGITDFYIQYEKNSKALELIEIYLSENEKLLKLEKFEHSKIVAALFPDDEMWYRAKLLREVPSKGYEVLFIDYGNTSISPECREIADDIAKLPPLSKKCALELPEHCLSWSDAAEEKFAEIAAMGETIFTVELRAPAAEHAIVHLLIDEHNINDDLELLCEHKPVEPNLNASFCNAILQTSVCECGVLYDAVVAHVNSPNDFYVQCKKDIVRLEDMSNSLSALGMDTLAQPEVGQLCAAVYPEDKALYRARILDVVSAERKEYRVLFIDFGNEAVSSELRCLPQDLIELKEFSRHCQLQTAHEQTSAAVNVFNELINSCEGLVKVEFVNDDTDPAVVNIFNANTEENIGKTFEDLLDLEASKVELAAVPENTCLISHSISPAHFYVQPKVHSSKMEFVARALQKDEVQKLPKLLKGEVDSCCSVYSEEDDCYYRGRIVRTLENYSGYEFFLLDHGNTIITDDARELPAELSAMPALAWKCKLNMLPEAADRIVEDKFAALLEAHFGEIFEIEMDELDVESDVHTVKLQVNYKDLSDELAKAVKNGDAQTEVLSPVPTLFDCSVIHVNSPTSFYIQLASDISALQNITDILIDAETDFKPFTDVRVGAICAAQFPDDLAFYRAKIVQLLEDGKCEVHYLDFGNNSITDQFRALPESMLNLDEFSKHCALDVNLSTPEACMHFEMLIDARFSETFQVEFLKTSSDPRICRLFYQDKNVASEVTQLLKNGSGTIVVGEAAADRADISEACDINNGGVENAPDNDDGGDKKVADNNDSGDKKAPVNNDGGEKKAPDNNDGGDEKAPDSKDGGDSHNGPVTVGDGETEAAK